VPDRFFLFGVGCPPKSTAYSCIQFSRATVVLFDFWLRAIDRFIIMKPFALFLSLFVFFGFVAAWSKEGIVYPDPE